MAAILDAGPRLAVVATFEPTAMMVRGEIEAAARARNLSPTIEVGYVPGALAALQSGRAEEHDVLVAKAAAALPPVDGLMLALVQGKNLGPTALWTATGIGLVALAALAANEAIVAEPMLPLAPARLSTTSDTPRRSDRRCAMPRAMASTPVPGVNGTTMVTGRAG